MAQALPRRHVMRRFFLMRHTIGRGLAGAVLVLFLAVRRGLGGVRRALAPGSFVGVIGMAVSLGSR